MRKKVKKLQKITCLLLTLGILVLETATVNAVELSEVRADAQTKVCVVAEDDSRVHATLAMPDIMPLVASGQVVATGVVLRKGPNTSTEVLALMDYGESVVIDETISSAVPGGYWYYVMRIKTGTWGWVDSSCIYKF